MPTEIHRERLRTRLKDDIFGTAVGVMIFAVLAYYGMHSVVAVAGVLSGLLFGGFLAYQGPPPRVISTASMNDSIDQELVSLVRVSGHREHAYITGGFIFIFTVVGGIYAINYQWWDADTLPFIVLSTICTISLIWNICWIWTYIRILHADLPANSA